MKIRLLFPVLSLLICLSIIGYSIKLSIELDRNCTGYLKRAADANTVETAKEEISRSISYLEKHNLTNGYTSVLWETPDEDIGFWYRNLKQSENELSKVDSTTSQLDKTNLLMKLRETLLDNEEKGDKITFPDGLSRYPHNAVWLILFWFVISQIFMLFIKFDWLLDLLYDTFN